MAVKYIDWKPVSVSYINNKLDLSDAVIGTSDGLIFSENNLASCIRSLDFNENSLVFLTDLIEAPTIETKRDEVKYQNNLIRNCIMTSASGYYLTRTRYDSANIATSAESTNNIFQLEFDTNDDALSIVSEDLNQRLYLTVDATGACAYFDVYNSDIEHLQKFKYILNTDTNTLVLFCSTCDTSGYRVVSYDESTPGTSLVTFETYNPLSANSCYSYLFKLKNVDLSIKPYTLNSSRYVKYESVIDNNDTIYGDMEIASSQSFPNNYLIATSFKDSGTYTPTTDYTGQLKSNAVSLKNLFTPEYKYSKRNDVVLNRDYQTVTLGDNIVDDAYNKVTTSYSASTKQFNLEPDKLTYFHYPYGTSTVPISSSGLIEAGAIAGLSPIKADRIWKSQFGYETSTNNGNSTTRNGTWLCSWLSGNNCQSIWVDRWYNPQQIEYKLALTADEPNPYISDAPSTLTFEAGVLYKYFHIGAEYSLKLIEDADFNNCDKVLEIKNWTKANLENATNSTEDNITYTRFNNSEFTFTGSEYISYSASESFFAKYNLTVAAWVYFDNWSNAAADQIIGNYYNGGYGLSYHTGIKDDFLIYTDSTYGHIFVTNTEGRYLFDKAIPGTNAAVTDMSVDGEGRAWILDDNQNKIFVYNPINNVFENIIDLPATTYKYARHDKYNNFYVYSSNKVFKKYDRNGDLLTTKPLAFLTNTFLPLSTLQGFDITGFFIDSASNIQPYIGTTAFEDLSGNYWHHFGSNLIKNNINYILHITSPDDLKVDGDLNLWMIKDDTLYHFDKDGSILLKRTYPYISSGPKKLAITRELTNSGWKDFIWVMDKQSIIKYSSSGRFEKIIKPTDYFSTGNYPGRDRNKLNLTFAKYCTKYNFYRDAKLLNPGLDDKNYITANFKITNGTSVSAKELIAPTNALSRGWHHLALTFDSANGVARLYVDGQTIDSISFAEGQYMLDYTNKNTFYIGNTNDSHDTKEYTWLLDKKPTMVGKIDDIRVYSCALSERDVLVLSRKKLKFTPVEFNVTAPTRQYIETIDRFNTHRTPGFKSNIFNIRILNSDLDSEDLKESIEDAICKALTKITPVGAKLNKIVWE